MGRCARPTGRRIAVKGRCQWPTGLPAAGGTGSGRNAVLAGVPTPVLQSCLGHRSLAQTERYVTLAGGHHEWVERL